MAETNLSKSMSTRFASFEDASMFVMLMTIGIIAWLILPQMFLGFWPSYFNVIQLMDPRFDKPMEPFRQFAAASGFRITVIISKVVGSLVLVSIKKYSGVSRAAIIGMGFVDLFILLFLMIAIMAMLIRPNPTPIS